MLNMTIPFPLLLSSSKSISWAVDENMIYETYDIQSIMALISWWFTSAFSYKAATKNQVTLLDKQIAVKPS